MITSASFFKIAQPLADRLRDDGVRLQDYSLAPKALQALPVGAAPGLGW